MEASWRGISVGPFSCCSSRMVTDILKKKAHLSAGFANTTAQRDSVPSVAHGIN